MIPDLSAPPYADYESPPRRPGWLARALPSLSFYSRIAWIIYRASLRAKAGQFGDNEWYQASYDVRLCFEQMGTHLSIRGTRHLAGLTGPCVIIGNHMSTAETFLLAHIIVPFRPVTFVVKQGLVNYPVFRHVMLSRDPIIVGRTNPREDLKAVIDGGQARMRNGLSLGIFPQRTRTVAFERAAFNTIGVKLARRADVPIIPLALKTDAWGNGRWIKECGPFRPQEPVILEFGAPIPIEGNERAAHTAVIDFIEGRLREWGIPVVG